MKETILRSLTTTTATYATILLQLLIVLSSDQVITLLQELGLGVNAAVKVKAGVQLGLLILTGLGFSPLKRPDAPPTPQ